MAENMIVDGAQMGRKLLTMTSSNAAVSEIEKVIASGASLDETDKRGRTPLHIAVEGNKIGIVSLLVAKGCRLDVRDNQSRTAATVAASMGRKDASMILAEAMSGEITRLHDQIRDSEQELEEAMMGKARAEMSMLKKSAILDALASKMGTTVDELELEFNETGGMNRAFPPSKSHGSGARQRQASPAESAPMGGGGYRASRSAVLGGGSGDIDDLADYADDMDDDAILRRKAGGQQAGRASGRRVETREEPKPTSGADAIWSDLLDDETGGRGSKRDPYARNHAENDYEGNNSNNNNSHRSHGQKARENTQRNYLAQEEDDEDEDYVDPYQGNDRTAGENGGQKSWAQVAARGGTEKKSDADALWDDLLETDAHARPSGMAARDDGFNDRGFGDRPSPSRRPAGRVHGDGDEDQDEDEYEEGMGRGAYGRKGGKISGGVAFDGNDGSADAEDDDQPRYPSAPHDDDDEGDIEPKYANDDDDIAHNRHSSNGGFETGRESAGAKSTADELWEQLM